MIDAVAGRGARNNRNNRNEMSGALSEAGLAALAASLFAVLLQLQAGAAAAEGMPVAPGDVLRVSVSGGPELGQDAAKVGADGRIVLPGLDTIEVAGADLDAVRQRIESVLVARDLIREPVVSVEVVSYRPFYVGGAVAQPGAIAYEPGLTVRHGLILAGGIDRSIGPEKLSGEGLVELKARHESVDFALVEVRSRIARLRAELEDAEAPDFSDIAFRNRAFRHRPFGDRRACRCDRARGECDRGDRRQALPGPGDGTVGEPGPPPGGR